MTSIIVSVVHKRSMHACIFAQTIFNFAYFLQSPESSYDFSSNDPDPFPRYTLNWFNR